MECGTSDTGRNCAHTGGVCERSFRRYIGRYEADGLDGLIDRRLEQVSNRRAPVDEVLAMTKEYRSRYMGWNVKHSHSLYKRTGGTRSYTLVKRRLQEAGLVPCSKKRGAHRKRRERSPMPGMMIHQDDSTHEWVAGKMWDLIVTMGDATSEHYSMFFVEEEGTASSFQGVREVIKAHGLFISFYSDRDSHYWNTPEAGGKVDKENLTQFGWSMKQLGIEMIPAYSPEARGRSERAFGTHQGRLPFELAAAGITDMETANRYLREVYIPAFNAEFACRVGLRAVDRRQSRQHSVRTVRAYGQPMHPLVLEAVEPAFTLDRTSMIFITWRFMRSTAFPVVPCN